MEIQDRARIIAFARLLGVVGTDTEIIEKYTKAYNEALASLQQSAKSAEVEVFKRPF